MIYARYRIRKQRVLHVKPPPVATVRRQPPQLLEQLWGERRGQYLHGSGVDVVGFRVGGDAG